MLAVIQKVSEASVEVFDFSKDNKISEIKSGICILLAIGLKDSKHDAEIMANKILRARFFENEAGLFKQTIKDINGEILVIPQFTLYGDIFKKSSPSFSKAMNPIQAKELFAYFCSLIQQSGIKYKQGTFQEYMQVKITNEGPVTFILNTDKNEVEQKSTNN